MTGVDKHALMAALKNDAAKLGISVEELIKRIMSSGGHVVGSLGAGEIPQGPTYISAEGGGVWNNIADAGEPVDDFEELAQNHSRFLEEAEGDDLARDILLRNHVTKQQAAQSPFVNQNPPSAASAMLGSTQHVSTGLGKGGVMPRGLPVTCAYWVDGDAHAQPVVVTFAPISQIGGIASQIDAARAIGIITFGTKATQQTIEVDIGQGCEVQVSGSSVTASVALEGGNSGGVPDGDQLTATLAAMISFRTIFRASAPITKSVYFDPLSGAGSHLVPVPAFAKKVWLTRNNLATVSVDLFGQDSVGERRWQFSLATTVSMTDPIILDGSITNIEVVKTAGADSSAQLVFELGV